MIHPTRRTHTNRRSWNRPLPSEAAVETEDTKRKTWKRPQLGEATAETEETKRKNWKRPPCKLKKKEKLKICRIETLARSYPVSNALHTWRPEAYFADIVMDAQTAAGKLEP